MATYDEVIELALRRALFYPASDIYQNAPAGFYDFGPYGAAIKRKIVELWRKLLIQNEDMLEIDGAITMPADVFQSSGHLKNFNDPMTSCKKCGAIQRADNILTEKTKKEYKEAMSDEELTKALREHKIVCPKCKGELNDVKRFNMMVKAEVGVATKAPMYLRPETCQSIFTNYERMLKTMRMKLPKGIAQYGKSFRNEISPRQSLLRQVEFHQMEAEVFFDPKEINEVKNFKDVENYKLRIMRAGKDKVENITAKDLVSNKIVSGQVIAYYLARTQQLYEAYGFKLENMRFRELDDKERAFYAKEGWDFEVNTSLGWVELIANNYRTDYDLEGHQKGSGRDLSFLRQDNTRVIPHVWEISIGTDRTFYAVLENSLKKDEKRTWLSLPAAVVPIQASIFPLLSNKDELTTKAEQVYKELKKTYEVFYDESGSIGKRYARVDEVGCPLCITIDFDTLTNNDVTIRDRDSSEQKRVKIVDLKNIIQKLLEGVEFNKL